jgi:hypothetical protein
MFSSCKLLILKRKGDVRRRTNDVPRAWAKEEAEKQGKPESRHPQFCEASACSAMDVAGSNALGRLSEGFYGHRRKLGRKRSFLISHVTFDF